MSCHRDRHEPPEYPAESLEWLEGQPTGAADFLESLARAEERERVEVRSWGRHAPIRTTNKEKRDG